MATKLKRVTFTVTKDLEQMLVHAKKNLFYDKNQSEMIRELVIAGLKATDKNK